MANSIPEPQASEPPKKATKAQIGAAIGVVVTFLTSIQANIDDGISASEWLSAIIATLVAAGAVFTGVYYTTNKPK